MRLRLICRVVSHEEVKIKVDKGLVRKCVVLMVICFKI